MALRPAKSIISFFKKLEKQSSDLPLDTIRIFNKKNELTGICLLSSHDTCSLTHALSTVVIENGGSVGRSRGDTRIQSNDSSKQHEKPATKKDIANLLQCEMDATRLKKVPCAFIVLRVTGKRSPSSDASCRAAGEGFFQTFFSTSDLFQLDSAASGLYGKKENKSSFAYDFYFVLPDTGINKAKHEIEAVRVGLRQCENVSRELKGFKMSVAVGIFHASDRILASELIDKVVAELKKSEKKKGLVSIVTCASKDNCQVTVAERTQLFGFIKP